MSDKSIDANDANAHLLSGYAESDPGEKRRRRLAATFKLNPEFERMAADPELRGGMSQHTRLAFGSYMAAKEAFEAERKVKA